MIQRQTTAAMAAAITLAVALAWPAGARGETPAPAAPALSPAVEAALKNFADEEFATRDKAAKALQMALAEQLRALSAAEDEGARARVAVLLEFQEGITRWAVEAMKTPKDQRARLLAWGVKPEVMPAIAKVYAGNPEKRVEGVKALAAMKDEEATWLLAPLLQDEHREVYLAAMEAAWDRPATPAIVDALWSRAVESGFAVYRPRVVGAPVVLRGRVIAGGAGVDYRRTVDSEAATDTLVQLKSPEVSARLVRFLADIEKELEKNENSAYMFMPYNEPARNVYRLIDAYQPPEAVAFLLRQLDAKLIARQQIAAGGKAMFVSNRTPPLAALIGLNKLKHEDFKLAKSSAGTNATWAVASEAEEAAAIEKFKAWYAENKGRKGVTTAPAATTPGLPATTPAPAPGENAGGKADGAAGGAGRSSIGPR